MSKEKPEYRAQFRSISDHSETYPLDKAHEAIAKLESRSAIGKLVVTM